ncbi:hypothetical protein [Bacillus cereus]|uniref:hypothetical protein n=1 Tax=Bacillus cereus TaxID=1396 RepID=UPI00032DA837|nr:hypothetical protein [Bacillus cereus]EOO44186.1 hypothetical protein ICK_06443 [Bacillus cereus BAG1X2-2]EOP00415.1 hypothetical protein ICO_06371 [Bacillus cereus BAG2O-1]
MKGVVRLTVVIDYEKMLKAENLKAIQDFTGAETEEEMMKLHMSQLSESIVSIVQKPLMEYELDGKFIDDNHVQQQAPTEWTPSEEDYKSVEHEVENVQEIAEPDVEFLEKNLSLVKEFEDDIERVSTELGIPKSIRINGDMLQAIQSDIDYLTKSQTENGVLTRYNGFPVEVQGMEEKYQILYQEYNSQTIGVYTHNK